MSRAFGIRTTEPAAVLIPSPSLREVQGGWDVPVELVMACTTSAFKDIIRRRANSADAASPTARVFLAGKRFFAQVTFLNGRPALVIGLEVWCWENAR